MSRRLCSAVLMSKRFRDTGTDGGQERTGKEFQGTDEAKFGLGLIPRTFFPQSTAWPEVISFETEGRT